MKERYMKDLLDIRKDIDKIDAFMKKLKFASYAPTLGGIRTDLGCG